MGDCVESLAEAEVDNIHSSPLIYPASLSRPFRSGSFFDFSCFGFFQFFNGTDSSEMVQVLLQGELK